MLELLMYYGLPKALNQVAVFMTITMSNVPTKAYFLFSGHPCPQQGQQPSGSGFPVGFLRGGFAFCD
jgi:hypothetical protein